MLLQQKIIVISIVLVVLLFGLFLFLKNNPKENSLKNETLVAFGDSLVKGYGASPGHDFVSVLSSEIGKPIINQGVNGDTSEKALKRIDSILALDPGLVILVVGGNDAIQKIPIEQTSNNISQILNTFNAHDIRTVLVAVRGGIFEDPYASMYKKLAEQYNVVYVSDILEGLFGSSSYMSDPIHPNDEGYRIIALRLTKVLSQIVK